MLSGALKAGKVFEVTLSDGSTKCCTLRQDFESKPIVGGRGVDLSKAYKQVALSPKSLKHGVLGVRRADSAWAFFVTNSLPFGASASIFAFNKITRGIWTAFVRKFGLLACVFYDDFPVVEFQPLFDLTTRLIHQFLDLLGWLRATTGKKAEDFSANMTVLGVVFNLSQIWEGNVKVENKPGRLERLTNLLQPLTVSGKVTKREAAVIHGLLNFAGNFVLGRALKPCLHEFASFLSSIPEARRVRETAQATLNILANLRPRWLRRHENDKPVILYTDGAWEPSSYGAQWGAVMIDRISNLKVVHGGKVPEKLVQSWRYLTGEQIICQIELFVVLKMKVHYMACLAHRQCFVFVDNEAARATLVKGVSPSRTMFKMAHCLNLVEARYPTSTWYERVPSPSNIADLPSRSEGPRAADLIQGEYKGDLPLHEAIVEILASGSAFDFELLEKLLAL